jgi:hypothetical protein
MIIRARVPAPAQSQLLPSPRDSWHPAGLRVCAADRSGIIDRFLSMTVHGNGGDNRRLDSVVSEEQMRRTLATTGLLPAPAGVDLCGNSGGGRSAEDYLVTIAGWACRSVSSTGYADLAGGITTAQGAPEPMSTGMSAWLNAGYSGSTSSTLIPSPGPPDGRQVRVAIAPPDTALASETFTVDIGPNHIRSQNPSGSQP